MAEEARNLRQALLAVALNKKQAKIQQKIQTMIVEVATEFENRLLDHIQIVNKLQLAIALAERHNKNLELRDVLNQCADLTKDFSQHFTKAYDTFELILPVSSINPEWINTIDRQEKHLIKITDALSQIQVLPCNREVIEIVQRMVMQITDMQEKIKVSTEKVRDVMHETVKYGSNTLNSQRNELESSDDDISFVPDDSNDSFYE